MNILQQALSALEHAHKTIGGFVQRNPAVKYSSDLYGDMTPAMMGLRRAIELGNSVMLAQQYGAKVMAYELGGLRIEDNTPLRFPPSWVVRDADANRLSKAGTLDFPPVPPGSVDHYEWLRAHSFDSAEEAIKAAADYLAKEGGKA